MHALINLGECMNPITGFRSFISAAADGFSRLISDPSIYKILSSMSSDDVERLRRVLNMGMRERDGDQDCYNAFVFNKDEFVNFEILSDLFKVYPLQNATFLNICGSTLTSMPSQIGLLVGLTELRINCSSLKSLPKEIGLLRNLRILSISCPALTELTSEIGLLSNLRELSISCPITELSSEIGSLTNLEELSICNTFISRLPLEIGYLHGLRKLTFINNPLLMLTWEIGSLNCLHTLTVSSSKLVSLPSEIGYLSSLRHLDLRSNLLKSLPSEIGRLNQLESLDLRNNLFKSRPAEISSISNLVLSMEGNPLGQLNEVNNNVSNFESLCQLVSNYSNNLFSFFRNITEILPGMSRSEASILEQNIPRIVISSDTESSYSDYSTSLFKHRVTDLLEHDVTDLLKHDVSEISPSMSRSELSLEQLSDDDCSLHRNNALSKILSRMNRADADELERDISKLNSSQRSSSEKECSFNFDIDFTTLSDVFKLPEFQCVTKLSITSSALVALPKEVRLLTNLRYLNITAPNMTSITPKIGALTNLRELIFLDTAIEDLPSEIRFLLKLERLIMEKSHLSTLPPEIGSLVMLKELTVTSSGLLDIPSEIGFLRKLTKLNLDSNSIEELPSEIGLLSELINLRLENNLIAFLPSEICFLDELKWLSLKNNRLVFLPNGIGRLNKLRSLTLNNNYYFSVLPEQIFNLSDNCEIDLDGCHALSNETLQDIHEHLGYGPMFWNYRTLSQHHSTETELSTIEGTLISIYEQTGRSYKRFRNVQETEALESWLDRLNFNADHRSPITKKWLLNHVLDYLELAEVNKPFCDIFEIIIEGASETCGDRMALSIVDIGISAQLIQIRDPKELSLFLKKGVWALQLIQEHSLNKIETLTDVDQIEVHLGFMLKLKERLQLPINVRKMLYFASSSITEQDLDEAYEYVATTISDENNFHKFLSENDYWRKMLASSYKKEYTKAMNPKMNIEEDHPDFWDLQSVKVNEALIALTKKVLNPAKARSTYSDHNQLLLKN